MNCEAVIFDLGGTLTYPFYHTEYLEVRKKIAAVVSAPEDGFQRIWNEDGHLLGAGKYPSYQAFVRDICERLGVETEDHLIESSVEAAYDMTRRLMNAPRDGAIELLLFLRENGCRTALVSDCPPDVPELWDESPYAPLIDVTVFSCEVGLVKEDTRIFELAVDMLGVEPRKCIYVADGMRKELASAAALGMRALRLQPPGEHNSDPRMEKWDGETISSLMEVITFLG